MFNGGGGGGGGGRFGASPCNGGAGGGGNDARATGGGGGNGDGATLTGAATCFVSASPVEATEADGERQRCIGDRERSDDADRGDRERAREVLHLKGRGECVGDEDGDSLSQVGEPFPVG